MALFSNICAEVFWNFETGESQRCFLQNFSFQTILIRGRIAALLLITISVSDIISPSKMPYIDLEYSVFPRCWQIFLTKAIPDGVHDGKDEMEAVADVESNQDVVEAIPHFSPFNNHYHSNMYIYLYFIYLRIYSHLLLYLPHLIDHIKCLTRYVKKNFLWKKYQKSD